MKNIVDFFHEIGKLSKIPRRGWVLIGIKKPADIVDHSFRLAVMTWILGKGKRLHMEKAIKMALVHDLCELYAGDTTPYDYNSILPKDKRKWPKLFNTWPIFSKSEKIKFFRKKYNQYKNKKRHRKIKQKRHATQNNSSRCYFPHYIHKLDMRK